MEPDDFAGLTPDDPFFFVESPSLDLRKACDVAWIKSGTSTLETALMGTPTPVVSLPSGGHDRLPGQAPL